jgi:hypothetical protein
MRPNIESNELRHPSVRNVRLWSWGIDSALSGFNWASIFLNMRLPNAAALAQTISSGDGLCALGEFFLKTPLASRVMIPFFTSFERFLSTAFLVPRFNTSLVVKTTSDANSEMKDLIADAVEDMAATSNMEQPAWCKCELFFSVCRAPDLVFDRSLSIFYIPF